MRRVRIFINPKNSNGELAIYIIVTMLRSFESIIGLKVLSNRAETGISSFEIALTDRFAPAPLSS